MRNTKKCIGKCEGIKPLELFPKSGNKCKNCIAAYQKEYRKNNKEEIAGHQKEHYQNNKEKIKDYRKSYCQNNKEKIKKYYQENKEEIKERQRKYAENNEEEIKEHKQEYYQDNKEKISEYQKDYRISNYERLAKNYKEYYEINKEEIKDHQQEYKKERKKYDPAYKLRSHVSSAIWRMLKSQGSSKVGHSILEFLPSSIKEIWQHIEAQFEWWMTKENYGAYDPKTWNDLDPNTWRWQLDHIIPQSDLPYTSMEDENFKKCWIRSNLRPYSAKQNLLDGSKRMRHNNAKHI